MTKTTTNIKPKAAVGSGILVIVALFILFPPSLPKLGSRVPQVSPRAEAATPELPFAGLFLFPSLLVTAILWRQRNSAK